MVAKLAHESDAPPEVAEFVEIPGRFEDVTDIEDDLEAQLNAITEEFGGEDGDVEFKIHVKRILEGKGELAHLFSCLPNELPILDKLRDDYDGGRFEIWIYRDKKIFKRRKVTVEAPKKKTVVEQTGDNTALIMEGFSKLGELVAQRSAPVAPLQNPMEMMSMMMRQMILMKEFVGGGAAAAPPVDAFDMIEKVVSIQNLMGTDRSEPSEGATTADLLLELTRTFGKPIADMAAKAQTEVTGATPAPTNPLSASPGMGAPIPAKEKKNPMKMQLAMLLSFAKKNVDPAPYAQIVIDNAPKLDELLAFVRQSDAIEKMVEIYPPVNNYREWFIELGETIIEFAAPDDATEGVVDPEVVAPPVEPVEPVAGVVVDESVILKG